MNNKENDNKKEDARARRVRSDATFALMYIIGVGYITKETADFIGVIDLSGVIEVLSEEHQIEVVRLSTQKSDHIAFVIEGASRCSHCGKYGVSDGGMSDCCVCRSFQVDRSSSSRSAALDHMRTNATGQKEINHTYGLLHEFELEDLL